MNKYYIDWFHHAFNGYWRRNITFIIILLNDIIALFSRANLSSRPIKIEVKHY